MTIHSSARIKAAMPITFSKLSAWISTSYSSALKLNTQYMHTIHFNLKLRRGIDKDELMRRLKANSRVALTYKKSSASVFSFGRDHGMFGRILNQTVIVIPKPGHARRQRNRRHLFYAAGRQLAAEQHRRDVVVHVSGFLRREARAGAPLLFRGDLSASRGAVIKGSRSSTSVPFLFGDGRRRDAVKTHTVAGLDAEFFCQAAVDLQYELARYPHRSRIQ